jgi:hypothetical protein
MDLTTILYALGVLIAVMLDGHASAEGKWRDISRIPTVTATGRHCVWLP